MLSNGCSHASPPDAYCCFVLFIYHSNNVEVFLKAFVFVSTSHIFVLINHQMY